MQPRIRRPGGGRGRGSTARTRRLQKHTDPLPSHAPPRHLQWDCTATEETQAGDIKVDVFVGPIKIETECTLYCNGTCTAQSAETRPPPSLSLVRSGAAATFPHVLVVISRPLPFPWCGPWLRTHPDIDYCDEIRCPAPPGKRVVDTEHEVPRIAPVGTAITVRSEITDNKDRAISCMTVSFTLGLTNFSLPAVRRANVTVEDRFGRPRRGLA